MTDKQFREAWLKVAEAYAIPDDKRTREQQRISYDGLCCGFNYLTNCGIAINDALVAFRSASGAKMNFCQYPSSRYEYWYFPYCSLLKLITDEYRRDHAIWFATIGLKEFKKITGFSCKMRK